MRHRKKKTTLGRESAQRKALLRSLAESLVINGSIRTTKAKAIAVRTVVEPLITKARTGTLTARRQAIGVLYTDKAVKILMEEIGARYKDRKGGYTRITKIGPRNNDAAQMVRIELV